MLNGHREKVLVGKKMIFDIILGAMISGQGFNIMGQGAMISGQSANFLGQTVHSLFTNTIVQIY